MGSIGISGEKTLLLFTPNRWPLKTGHLHAYGCPLDSAIMILEFQEKSRGEEHEKPYFGAFLPGAVMRSAINPFDGSYQVF